MKSHEEDAVVLNKFLESCQQGQELGDKINLFVTKLKRRKFASSMELTQETLKLVRTLVNIKRWQSANELLTLVKAFGRRLVRARPVELVVGNVFRRVIHLIKEEYITFVQEQSGPGLHKVLDEAELMSRLEKDEFIEGWNIKGMVVEGITEMLAELENLAEPISNQALEHVHAEDRILIYGASQSVALFLKAAKRKRSFSVIVAEAAPGFTGHGMAKKLIDMGIPTTVITDSAVFAMMARVNKVIVGTHAVMANGGLMASSGTHMLALAAKHHAVPVICITGLYKLCPLFPYNRDAFIDLKSPGPTLPYSDLGAISDKVQVVSPSFDYVPPDLISLFITNTGGHQPSYIYRLLSEYYDTNAEEEL